MAKFKDSEPKAKVKFRFVEFELEGANNTVESSIRDLTTAIMKAQTVVLHSSTDNQSKLDSSRPNIPLEDSPTEFFTEDSNIDEPRQKSKNKKPVISKPKLLELSLSEQNALKEYAQKYNYGEADTKTYLIIFSWYKEQKKTEELSIDHIFTAYRALGKQPPENLLKPMQNMKSNNQWLDTGSEPATYKLTFVGENEVIKIRKNQD